MKSRLAPGDHITGGNEPNIVHIVRGEEASGGMSLVCGTYIPSSAVHILDGMVTDKPATCLWCIANVTRYY